MRTIYNFNDGWSFEKPGEMAFPVTLPHTWNAVDGQDGGNDYFRGTCCSRLVSGKRNEGYIWYLTAAPPAWLTKRYPDESDETGWNTERNHNDCGFHSWSLHNGTRGVAAVKYGCRRF